MIKKIVLALATAALSMCLMTGCGTSSNNVPESPKAVTEVSTTTEKPTTTSEATTITPTTAPEPTATAEPTEVPHEHTYAETILTEATCETDGVTSFTCECGDTYTETAKCKTCDATDTRTAEGSMLTYTYIDMDATMYAQKTVNVRSLPNTDGEKLGSLSTNDEVKVTGQCAETNWYRIEYSGDVAYVSDSYLGNDKVVVQAEAPKQTQTIELPTFSSFAEMRAYAISLGYPLGTAVDNGDGTATAYFFDFDGTTSFTDTWPNQSHDVHNARIQAMCIIMGNEYHYMGNSKASKVAIAKDPAGFTYYVYGEKIWHSPIDCDGTRCGF